MRMARGQVIGAAVLVAVLVVAGLVLFGGDGNGEPPPSQGALVGVGDCVDLPEGDDELLEAVDCEDPHDAQVFAEFQFDPGPYPGDRAVEVEAERTCIDRWDRAVGSNYYVDVSFDFVVTTPDEAQWEAASLEATCLLVSADGTPLVHDQLSG